MTSRPSFLGIGAPRSATTWLSSKLRVNPEIYLPPIKELHYFDMSSEYPSPSINKQADNRFWSRNHENYLSCSDPNKKNWFKNYLFGNFDDQWYISLFEGADEQAICGEITPAYSILEVTDIKRVYEINNEMKMIFMMRNPIERAWSAFLHPLTIRNHDFSGLTESEVENGLREAVLTNKGNYLKTIENWTSVFPAEQFYFGYYDHVKSKPRELLSEIFHFLGVRDSLPKNIDLYKKVNVGLPIEMPDKYRIMLHDIYDGQTMELMKKLDNPVIESWLDG